MWEGEWEKRPQRFRGDCWIKETRQTYERDKGEASPREFYQSTILRSVAQCWVDLLSASYEDVQLA